MRFEEINNVKKDFCNGAVGDFLASTLCFQSVIAQSGSDSASAEQVRVSVQRIGKGRDAKVEAKLRDGRKVTGYVSATGEDSFKVTNTKTGTSETVAYEDALHVKKSSGGVSRGWIIGGAAGAAAVIVGAIVLKPVLCDGGAQSRGPC